MAKVSDVAAEVSGGGKSLAPVSGLQQMLSKVDIKKRFEEVLGKKAPSFISSIVSAANSDANLKACVPMTVISAAMMAATLDLPINKSLGFAWIIPYKDKAEFQLGYKGYIQLAIRTGQYETMNASEIYEDEIKVWNPITGEIEFTQPATWKFRYEGKTEKIIGYVAFFKLVNGFRKYIYMTKAQIEAHAKRYAQSYTNPKGKWATDRHAMSLKTVLKLLLSKYGILSIEMQRAMQADQGVILEAGKDADPMVEYLDTTAENAENLASPAGDPAEATQAADPGTAIEP